MKEIHRRTWAQVDLDAVRHNFLEVKKFTKSKVCCVVKADAYGHGAARLAMEYEKLGADFFAVSNIEEALQIRRAGVAAPILILGYTPSAEAETLAKENISQSVYSTEYAEELSAAAESCGLKVKAHIKIDTGMSRIGFYYQDINRDEAAIAEVAAVCRMPGLEPEGIFTHFAVADEGSAGDSFTMRQFGCFKEMIESLQREGIRFAYRHCANSGAITDFPLSHLDMVRAGVILYGLEPSQAIRNKGDFIPTISLKSVISHVKTLMPGATVSYGRTFTAEKEMKIATVPIGYADGYTRQFAANGAQILVKGRRCPILGRICMDQLMIDLGDLDAHIGDTVTVFGKDGGNEISVDELAELNGTINYEIICNIGARVPRIYCEGGKETGVLDYICPEE